MCWFLLDCIIEPSCYSEGIQVEVSRAMGNTMLEEGFLPQGAQYILSEGQTKNKDYRESRSEFLGPTHMPAGQAPQETSLPQTAAGPGNTEDSALGLQSC